MKKFTCPCFVRVEDMTMRNMLSDYLSFIGYELRASCQKDVYYDLIGTNGTNGTAHSYPLLGLCSGYDCGNSTELFKALVAMNDINDYMQLFTDGLDHFELSEWKSWSNFWYGDPYEGIYYNWRKATKEEIINHFLNNKV